MVDITFWKFFPLYIVDFSFLFRGDGTNFDDDTCVYAAMRLSFNFSTGLRVSQQGDAGAGCFLGISFLTWRLVTVNSSVLYLSKLLVPLFISEYI